MFADKVKIYISSGRGGDGHVSFRRELYVPAGGPNGGDGGKGGDVIFVVDKGLNTLSDFRYNKKYCAQNGEEGGKNRCHGKSGADLVIKVPEGTVIKDADSGLVIADLSGENLRKVILKGGRGGKGNMHYATSTMQAPRYAQPGEDGTGLYVTLELKLIADVGLIGLPNVGKSTLISRVSNAQPKIADYHFTTLNPVLGVVDDPDGAGFVIADIPGIIEGASSGAGLGYEFLRHIERTRVLVHVVDAAGIEGRDPVEDIRTINNELSLYNEQLMERPQVIAANKLDALSEEEAGAVLEKLRNEFGPEGYEVFPISAVSGKGLKELLGRVKQILAESPEERIIFETEFTPERQEVVLPYSVTKSTEEEDVYIVEGPRIERMLGYTNLESEKGLEFLQKFIQDSGITKQLIKLGIKEGDTVRMYGHEFEFFM
ncbi:MAG: GTPase ObgE [Lachnospiraceae bacterium]|nr:GTPase ObgE [Lachnospiraceae bacterium]